MARLLVEAIAHDWGYLQDTSSVERARISVSVSDATTGEPVTGLTKEHFTVRHIGGTPRMTVADVMGTVQNGFYAVLVQGTEEPAERTAHYAVAVSASAGKGQTLVEMVTSPNA